MTDTKATTNTEHEMQQVECANATGLRPTADTL